MRNCKSKHETEGGSTRQSCGINTEAKNRGVSATAYQTNTHIEYCAEFQLCFRCAGRKFGIENGLAEATANLALTV